jgi:cyclopropane-fatty-acyl-phospholipid synthase
MAGVVAALLAWLTSGLSIFVDKVLQPLLMPLVQADLVPDFLIRFGIRLMLGGLLTSLDKGNPVENVRQKLDYVRDLKQRKKIAENTQESKEQHYEVPAAFYDLCLGSWKKYSCGLWPAGCETLEASEEEALRVVCERAKITNTK